MWGRQLMVRTIKEILEGREPKRINAATGQYRYASVLIPLLDEGGCCRVLFTKRTQTVEHHKGQISFPGGAVEPGDSSNLQTALRETYEEIGVLKEDVEVLGRIDDTVTMASNFIIQPFVGFIPHPYEFVLNPAEVERLLSVPLEYLLNSGSKPREKLIEFEGKDYWTLTYEYDGEVIWGATARVVQNFMEVAGNKSLLLSGDR